MVINNFEKIEKLKLIGLSVLDELVIFIKMASKLIHYTFGFAVAVLVPFTFGVFKVLVNL